MSAAVDISQTARRGALGSHQECPGESLAAGGSGLLLCKAVAAAVLAHHCFVSLVGAYSVLAADVYP